MRKGSTAWAFGLALCVGGFGFAPLGTGAENTGHRFGEWPAISAMIHHEFQKNLDLDGCDFLLEVWFSPLPERPYQGLSGVLISKKCADRLRGYTLAYRGSTVSFTACDARTELDRDHVFTADAGLVVGEWCYLAVAYSRDTRQLTFFKNGKTLKAFADVELGDLSNRDTFNIGYYENRGSSPAHSRVREARIWKLRPGLPDDLASLVEGQARDPSQPADALAADAAYSRWVFTAANEDLVDRGNNGNTLCYVPFGYEDRVAIKPFPAKPSGTTYYVDGRAAGASDDGRGSKVEPFKTIARGVRAALPGDVVHICAGTYREQIYPRAGANGNPVTIEGEDGTVILGSEPLAGWARKRDDLWEIPQWNGAYAKPADPKVSDARSTPGNVIFVDDEPMDFVKTRHELVPGTWTAEPMLGRGTKRLLLAPLPGVDPATASVEITVGGLAGLQVNKFNHVKNLCFRRCSVGLRGIGNILEGCTIEWTPFVALGIYGQDHVVRGNKILWGGNSGVGGSSARLLFENNLLSYNGWRNYSQGWHGGAVKLIPGNTDHIMRNNTFCYNDLATIWYDALNQGNLVEGNVCHDNCGHGGIFDEIDFGNTFQYNLLYNNYGNSGDGFCIAESHEDRLYRNIVFNNYGSGIRFRGGNTRKTNSPEERAALKEEFWAKLDARRYQGYVSFEREKRFRDSVDEYWCRYPARCPEKRNEVIENVIFDNHGPEISLSVRYDQAPAVPTGLENLFRGNIYWSSTGDEIVRNLEANAGVEGGVRHTGELLDPKTWRGLSGQDTDSQFMDPWANRDRMPEWFRKRFRFNRDAFRPIGDVVDGCLSNVRKSTARTVLLSRLLRSKTLAPIGFTDPLLFGCTFDMDGARCAAVWSKGVGTREFLVPGADGLVYESKYLKRRALNAGDGRVRVLVGAAPVTLIGIGDTIMEDRCVVAEVPMWTAPGAPVTARLVLANLESSALRVDLNVAAGEGWTVSRGPIRQTLKAGETNAIDIALTPPADVRHGMFQFHVRGTANGRKIAVSKHFGIGSLLALKRVADGLKMDGDLADWGSLEIPNGIAEMREQVVFGSDHWSGRDDLSARVWLRWKAYRELYLAVEVRDDNLVTGGEDPLRSDGIQVMVDVRSEWKHFMNECTAGTFNLTLMPGNATTPATATYGRLRLGSVRGVACRGTDNGYIMELDIHFHTAQVDDPGWVVKRPVRIGVLVHDSDDPETRSRDSTIGVWRTAADAVTNCASLTTFVTE